MLNTPPYRTPFRSKCLHNTSLNLHSQRDWSRGSCHFGICCYSMTHRWDNLSWSYSTCQNNFFGIYNRHNTPDQPNNHCLSYIAGLNNCFRTHIYCYSMIRLLFWNTRNHQNRSCQHSLFHQRSHHRSKLGLNNSQQQSSTRCSQRWTKKQAVAKKALLFSQKMNASERALCTAMTLVRKSTFTKNAEHKQRTNITTKDISARQGAP